VWDAWYEGHGMGAVEWFIVQFIGVVPAQAYASRERNP
jgi:hypothetical protein